MYGTFSLFAVALFRLAEAQPSAIGISQAYQADPNVQYVANQVLGRVQNLLGGTIQEYTPIAYKTQPIQGGANYFVKVLLSTPQQGAQYVHLRISSSNGQTILQGMEINRTVNDPISYLFVKNC